MNTDLAYIAKHVHQWPEGAEVVQLDIDGEIRFGPEIHHDFYPEGQFSDLEDHPAFLARPGFRNVGREYTRDEWKAAIPITLRTLPFFTAQEVFDYVARHLLTQGEKAERFDESGMPLGCAYHAPGGLKCAAGCLISEEEYDPAMEGEAYGQIVCADDGPAPSDHWDLIGVLQGLHDNYLPAEWRERLAGMAKSKGLSPAVLDEFKEMSS